MESDAALIWDIVKTVMMVIIIPFCIWIVRLNMETKKQILDLKDDYQKFREHVASTYTPKVELAAIMDKVDDKMSSMQTAITQRIDSMQATLAGTIAQLGKK